MSLAVIVACACREWIRPATLRRGALAARLASGPGDWVARSSCTCSTWGRVTRSRCEHRTVIGCCSTPAVRGAEATRGTRWWCRISGIAAAPVDLFVLSHPHTDHVGGAVAALRVLHPPTYLDAGFPGAEAYRASLEEAREDHVQWRRAHPGDHFEIDGVSLSVLAPDSGWTASLDDPNLASVVVLAQYGDVRMLFMGDAERPEEEWLLSHERDELRRIS